LRERSSARLGTPSSPRAVFSLVFLYLLPGFFLHPNYFGGFFFLIVPQKQGRGCPRLFSFYLKITFYYPHFFWPPPGILLPFLPYFGLKNQTWCFFFFINVCFLGNLTVCLSLFFFSCLSPVSRFTEWALCCGSGPGFLLLLPPVYTRRRTLWSFTFLLPL